MRWVAGVCFRTIRLRRTVPDFQIEGDSWLPASRLPDRSLPMK
jgi:hypothetical protein